MDIILLMPVESDFTHVRIPTRWQHVLMHYRTAELLHLNFCGFFFLSLGEKPLSLAFLSNNETEASKFSCNRTRKFPYSEDL